MSNNQSRVQKTLTTANTPCARSNPMLQTVKTVLLCDDLLKPNPIRFRSALVEPPPAEGRLTS
jgi:hypothetical protein